MTVTLSSSFFHTIKENGKRMYQNLVLAI